MGRPTEVSVDDVTEAVREAGEPVSAQEVAETLSCAQSTAYEKLMLAVEHGRLRTKLVHENARIYWFDPADAE